VTIKIRYAVVIILVMSMAFGIYSKGAAEQNKTIPFFVGEEIVYSIYAAGWKVGYQTIEVDCIQKYNGIDVYVLKGLSRSASFLSIFYRLNDKWSIYMEQDSLLPLRVVKDWQEGKKEGYYVYEIDQYGNTVTLHSVKDDKSKTMNSKNYVFDIFTLAYYYRKNYPEFEGTYTFDFLETRSLRTVHFKNEGETEVRVPKISRTQRITARRLRQIGGIGIDIYLSNDNLRIPLRIVVPSKLPRDRVLDIEFIIDKYIPGDGQKELPDVYDLL